MKERHDDREMIEKEYEIRCDEGVAERLKRTLARHLCASLGVAMRKYGLLLLALVILPPYFFGRGGWVAGVVLIYLASCLFVLFREDLNHYHWLKKHVLWGKTKMCIMRDGLLFGAREKGGIRILYLFSAYESLTKLWDSFIVLAKKGGKSRGKLTEVIIPFEIAEQDAKQIVDEVRKGIERYAASEKTTIPYDEFTYKGEQIPTLATKGKLPPIHLSNILSGLTVDALSVLCLLGLELATKGSFIFSSLAWIVGSSVAWGVLISWREYYSKTPLTCHYSLRKRAVIIRSTDWVAVVPYSQIRTLHVGKRCSVLELINEGIFPCPSRLPEKFPDAIPRKPYCSGKVMCWFILCANTFLLYMLLGMIFVLVGSQCGFNTWPFL